MNSPNVVKCIICESPTSSMSAQIAPFLDMRCQLSQRETNTRYCKLCQFAFFERRLSREEAQRLYSGYRSAEYNESRIQVEPGYGAIASFMDDQYGDYFVKRIETYTNIMRIFPELKSGTVLDFGGDGNLAGRVFGSSELSYDDLSAGNNLHQSKFDIIFASQVFEHISDIRGQLLSLSAMLADDGVIIIDVPKEYEGSLSEGLFWQQRHGGALFYMHEHINHFSLQAIEAFVKTAGLIPIFTILPPHFRTILTIAGNPSSKLILKLASDAIQRELLWHARLNSNRSN